MSLSSYRSLRHWWKVVLGWYMCSCLLQQATCVCLCVYFRLENSITNSIWTQLEPMVYCQRCDLYCFWPVTVNEKQTKFQQGNCPHSCVILHYPWHFNSPLNYFQICSDSWFIQRSTLQINWSKNCYLTTQKSRTSKTSERGGTHFCGHLSYKMFKVVIVVKLIKCLKASVKCFQVFQD